MEDKTKNHILLIGGTGFTGKRVLHSLSHRHDIQVTCLLRPGSTLKDVPEGMTVAVVRGDLDDEATLKKAMAGKDGMIYVASLGFGHAETVVKAAQESRLKKCVFTSTTAIFTKLNASTKKIRKAAELEITNSDLNWTIIRPTMIYGRKGDRNMERLVKFLKRSPIIFIPGSGNSLQQPNFVDDVAGAVVAAYFNGKTAHKAYDISGKDQLTFNEVVDTIANVLDKKVWKIHVPLKLCLGILYRYESFAVHLGLRPWLKAEQVLRLNEDKVFTHDEAARDFGYTPKDFAEGVTELISELKK